MSPLSCYPHDSGNRAQCPLHIHIMAFSIVFFASSLGLFPFCLFLSNSDVLVFVLFYLFPLEACLFSIERQEGGASGWEGKKGGNGRSKGRRNSNKDVIYKIKSFFNKRGGNGLPCHSVSLGPNSLSLH